MISWVMNPNECKIINLFIKSQYEVSDFTMIDFPSEDFEKLLQQTRF
jgi:hypothetical protein